ASSLSAIVTPGTIVVQPSIITNKQLLIITQRDFISGIADNTTEQYVNRAFEEYENSTQSLVAFAGFTPQLGFGPGMNGSFGKAGVLSVDNDLNNMYNMLDMFSTDASKFYMRVHLALISCAFCNASYLVYFDLSSNVHCRIENPRLTVGPAVNQTMSYQSIMYQLGLNMHGYQSYPSRNASQPDFITMNALVGSPQMNYYAFNASGLQTLKSGGELSGRFPTVVRVTRDPELDRLIEEGEDRIGTDPLLDIAEATVRFGERAGENAAKDDIAQREWPEWI
ncbi:hypothetical protein V2W45_1226173, partial [Cenococcum geophilum]